ncbi:MULTISPECIES: hypothetical protein [unclassified Massilia]|uniref:hypothetical protein n=1 Tax=unclassified Massilia TaxID=2609279 RepID=UPI00177F873E|nr:MULTISPECIES: hypothetical protein [unclassified Massilia]MBD8532501.1 hypothetical protein [Massilia sp. CFBP 13647]MBD8675871.1 hypothetical protein [Massilia sp. CFBP 13721]
MKMYRLLMRSWPLVAGIGVLVMAARAMPRAEMAGIEACGLGLPPDAPGFAQQKEQRALEEKKNGFLRVCESNLQRYSITFLPLVLATRGLDFEPVDLRGTPFARLESLGGRSETVSGTVSRLYRGFRTPEGQALTVFEHDMSADGSSMWRDPKDEPERVNGLPARLVVMQTGSGRAVSVLSWRQGRRYYEIWLGANAARDPMRARLFDLASALPASVASCPNEPPPKRVTIGPDGFPVDEPMPATLTTAQMEASSGKRSCK